MGPEEAGSLPYIGVTGPSLACHLYELFPCCSLFIRFNQGAEIEIKRMVGVGGERRRKRKKEGEKGRRALILFLAPGNRLDLSSLVRPEGRALSRKQPRGWTGSRVRAPREGAQCPHPAENGAGRDSSELFQSHN